MDKPEEEITETEEEEKTLLDEAIEEAFEEYQRQPLGSDEREEAFKEAVELYDRRNEQVKIESSVWQRNVEIETNVAEKQKDRKLSIVTMLGSAALYLTAFFFGLHYEKTGVIGSTTVRNHVNRLTHWMPDSKK